MMQALPKALAARGHRVMCIAPRYKNYDVGWSCCCLAVLGLAVEGRLGGAGSSLHHTVACFATAMFYCLQPFAVAVLTSRRPSDTFVPRHHALPLPAACSCVLQDAWETGVRHKMRVFDSEQEVITFAWYCLCALADS